MDQRTALPTRSFVPRPATIDRLAPYVLSILRIVVALLFLEHGLSKLFGFPSPMTPPPLWTMEWFLRRDRVCRRRAADARPVHAVGGVHHVG